MEKLAAVFFAFAMVGCHERACEQAFQKVNSHYEQRYEKLGTFSGAERRADQMLLGQMQDQCVEEQWPSEVIDCVERIPKHGDPFDCMELLATEKLRDPSSGSEPRYREIDMDIWDAYPRLFLRQKD